MPNFGNAINVNVTANTSTGTLTVQGNNGSQIDVSQNTLEQPINWNLQLAAGQTGAFNPLSTDPATSGFSWTCSPAPSQTIMHNYAEPGTNGAQIQIVDSYTAPSATGNWTYKLRATVNGTGCQTNPPNPRALPGDPMIKNKPN